MRDTATAGSEYREDGEDGRLHNLLEPGALVRHFLACPPAGFTPVTLDCAAPAFSMSFDLLTTAQPGATRAVRRLPGYGWWKRLLHRRTCFIGTTVTEFAVLPRAMPPETVVRSLLARSDEHALLIIKDLPTEAVLVGEAAHAHSVAVANASRAAGFVLLEGQALAYVPVDFDTLDRFLSRMPRERRRDLRRKLKVLPALDISSAPTGSACFDDPALLECLYGLYLAVYRQSEIHFDLLTPGFFRAVLRDPACHGIVFLYREAGRLVGFNLCLVESGMLIDKFVGFAYPRSRELNLYMVSWCRNLEYAVERGLRCYVSGWTDPEIKRHLGARFTMTRHAVYATNRVLRFLLGRTRRFFESDRTWRDTHGGRPAS